MTSFDSAAWALGSQAAVTSTRATPTNTARLEAEVMRFAIVTSTIVRAGMNAECRRRGEPEELDFPDMKQIDPMLTTIRQRIRKRLLVQDDSDPKR